MLWRQLIKFIPWLVAGGLILKKGEEEYDPIYDYPQGPTDEGGNLGDYKNWKLLDKLNFSVGKLNVQTWGIIISAMFLSIQILKFMKNK